MMDYFPIVIFSGLSISQVFLTPYLCAIIIQSLHVLNSKCMPNNMLGARCTSLSIFYNSRDWSLKRGQPNDKKNSHAQNGLLLPYFLIAVF